MGKTYKDSERRGYDKRNKDEQRRKDRQRKQMNIDPGEFWDRNNKFRKNNIDEDHDGKSDQDLYSN